MATIQPDRGYYDPRTGTYSGGVLGLRNVSLGGAPLNTTGGNPAQPIPLGQMGPTPIDFGGVTFRQPPVAQPPINSGGLDRLYPGWQQGNWTPAPGSAQIQAQGGSYSPQNPAQPMRAPDQVGGGQNEQQLLQQAMQATGVTGTQMRNDPSAQQRVSQYLAQNGSPGWQFGGTQAGDWVQTPSGQQMDFLNSQGDQFQWIPDPASGSGGGGGNNAMPGYGGGGLGSGQASPYGGVATNAPLLQPFSQTFHAPTAEQAMQSPGLQFAMDEAQKALQRSAAAKGTLLTGGLLKGLQGTAIGQGLQGYNDVYNRALGEFNLGRDIFETNQGKQYNRLLGVSQLGENAASQTGAYGSQYAQNAGNLQTEQGNANAAGSLGGTLPWANAFTGIGNQYLQNMYLRQLGPSNIYGQ